MVAWALREVEPEEDWERGLKGIAPGGASGGPASEAGKAPVAVAVAVAEGKAKDGVGAGGGSVEVDVDVEVEVEGVSCRRYSEVESIRRVAVVRGVIVRADARKANNDMSHHFFV